MIGPPEEKEKEAASLIQELSLSYVLFLPVPKSLVQAIADKAKYSQEEDGPDVVDQIDDEIADAFIEVPEASGERGGQSL